MQLSALLATLAFPLSFFFPQFWGQVSVPVSPTPVPHVLSITTTPTPDPIFSPTPSPKPTQTPRPTRRPRSTATPKPSIQSNSTSTPTPRPTARPTTAPTSAPTSSVQDYIMNAINDYRHSQGLSSVQTDPYTCDFAQVRAHEITSGFNHDGFTNRVNSHTLPYPSYHYVNENIALNSDYKNVVASWIASPGHAENMRADTTYVCVERDGNYYAYEGWKP